MPEVKAKKKGKKGRGDDSAFDAIATESVGEEPTPSLEPSKSKKKKGKKAAKLAQAFGLDSHVEEDTSGGLETEVTQNVGKSAGFATLAAGNESKESSTSGSEQGSDEPTMPVKKSKGKKGKQNGGMGSAFAALEVEDEISGGEESDDNEPAMPMTKPKSKKKKGKGKADFGSAFVALDVEEDEDSEDEDPEVEAQSAPTRAAPAAGSAFEALAIDGDEGDRQSDGNDEETVLEATALKEKAKPKKKKKGKGFDDAFAALDEEVTVASLDNGADAKEAGSSVESSKKKKKSKGLASAFDELAEETVGSEIHLEQPKGKKGKKKKGALPLDDAFAALDEDEGPSTSMENTSGAFASLVEERNEAENDVSLIKKESKLPEESKVKGICQFEK